ncbi:MAG: YHYH protein [Planctomycetota bacterium]
MPVTHRSSQPTEPAGLTNADHESWRVEPRPWGAGDRWLIFHVLVMLGLGVVFAAQASAHGLEDHEHGHDHGEAASAWGGADELWVELASLDGAWASAVDVRMDGDALTVIANGLPDHATGRFPNRGNPNRIQPQSYRFSLPTDPRPRDVAQAARGYVFGVALNGVVFDPGTAERWTPDGLRRGGGPSDWTYEAFNAKGEPTLGLDASNAHVQSTGAYHYHGIPMGLLEARTVGSKMTLLGFAADGLPIYGPFAHEAADDASSRLVEMKSSYRLKPGTRPSGDRGPGGAYDGRFTEDWVYVQGAGDLDEANGRFGVTPQYPDGTYYYVLTADFPRIPRVFKAEPDDSFAKRRGRGGAGGPRPSRGM